MHCVIVVFTITLTHDRDRDRVRAWLKRISRDFIVSVKFWIFFFVIVTVIVISENYFNRNRDWHWFFWSRWWFISSKSIIFIEIINVHILIKNIDMSTLLLRIKNKYICYLSIITKKQCISIVDLSLFTVANNIYYTVKKFVG